MKNKKLIIGLAIGLIVLIAAFAGVYIATRPEANEGAKNISVTVVYKDKTDKEFKINTDAKYLSDALLEEKIVTEEEHNGEGMYTVIDGEKADYSVDQSWWCVTKDGEMTNEGMDTLVIADGDKYEITYTIS